MITGKRARAAEGHQNDGSTENHMKTQKRDKIQTNTEIKCSYVTDDDKHMLDGVLCNLYITRTSQHGHKLELGESYIHIKIKL